MSEASTATPEWERLARGAAGPDSPEQEPQLLRELLTLVPDGTPYAVPVERVREIIRPREITPMPRVPECVVGVVALRGQIVQVVDMRCRLGLAAQEPTRRSRIIVLHGDDDRVTGVMVDAVSEVLRVAEEQIDATTAAAGFAVGELCRRGDEFVSVVDLDQVLNFDEY